MAQQNVEVVRVSDMNPRLGLSLVQQEDGDIIVCIGQVGGRRVLPIVGAEDDPRNPGREDDRTANVEFCTHVGGGRSHHTLLALRALIQAMERDNAEFPQVPRPR